MQLVFKKNEDNANEILASLQNAQFSNFIVETNESEDEEEEIIEQERKEKIVVVENKDLIQIEDDKQSQVGAAVIDEEVFDDRIDQDAKLAVVL